MEKQTKGLLKLKFLILRLLPKVSAVTFTNAPYSPTKTHSGKILPGPIIPVEARLRPNKSLAREPSSPKISCMGQIKHKKKNGAKQVKARREKHASLPKDFNVGKGEPIRGRHVFDKQTGRKSDAGLGERAPSLSRMKRFASGREPIGKFDWTAEISPTGGDEKEVIIPFSAPMMLNGTNKLEPKKEINLWKRRPMSQLTPLRI